VLKVLHISGLAGIGGAEQKLRFYLKESAARGLIEHHLLVSGSPPHPNLRDDITAAAASVVVAKVRWGVKLPRWPAFLRQANFRNYLRSIDHDVVMLWDRFGDEEVIEALRNLSQAPVVHIECGGAWYDETDSRARAYAGGVASVVCSSRACRRVLELRWGWKPRVAAVVNGLRPDCRVEAVEPKRLPQSGPVRLGTAARMKPVKGLCLAVHALKRLRDSGVDAQLHLAGGGDAGGRKDLVHLVAALGLDSHVRFHGIVRDMPAFYRGIDIFLCPSLREPFGSVCLEAAAWGCVVVASRVDGLVEAVEDGVTGRCVAPDLPISEYALLGGGRTGLPSFVYDPQADAIASPPKIVSPEALARAVAGIVESRDAYERMSAAAVRRVRTEFPFDRYVAAIDGALLGAAGQC
jgi:glycosyltransferase involved in cell wall biosynthesis